MTATAAPAKSASLWEDFIDILYAPSSVFERRREGKFGAALLVLTVAFAAAYFATKPLMQPLMDRAMEQQVAKMQKNGMSAEQIEKARPTMEKITGITSNVAGVVGPVLLVVVSALMLWLVGKMFDSKASYGQVATVVTYANVPRVLGLLAGAGVLAMRDPATLPPTPQMSVGPALLLGPDASPALTMLLARFDVFTLWVTALSAIGLAIVGRTSRGKAFGAVAVTWVIATLVAVAQAIASAA